MFGASFAFMQQVADLRRENDGLALTLSDFGTVRARAIVLASGVSYRLLGIPALEELNGAGVFYGGPTSEAPAMADRDVYILGGANSAGQAALYLARYAAHVTVVVRADSLAAGMSHYLSREIEQTSNVSVRLRTEIVGGGGDAWLDHLVLTEQGSGREETVAAGGLFLMIGAHPRTEWLPSDIDRDDQGFILTGTDLPASRAWPLKRRPLLLETSMPAVSPPATFATALASGSPQPLARVPSRSSCCTACSPPSRNIRRIPRRNGSPSWVCRESRRCGSGLDA